MGSVKDLGPLRHALRYDRVTSEVSQFFLLIRGPRPTQNLFSSWKDTQSLGSTTARTPTDDTMEGRSTASL